MYNQVVEFNPIKPDEVIGDLAKSWEAKDKGLTYIFHLHEHVQWWDGRDLTAEDVAFSINRRWCFTGVDVLSCLRGRDNENPLPPFSASGRTIQHEINTYETPSIPDPDDWVNAIYGPGTRNDTRWRNPEFLTMLDQ